MATPAPRKPTQSQENLLLDYVHRLDRHRRGRTAVHIHLSRLKPQNRRENHVQIATNTIEPMVRAQMGQLFILKNADFIFIYKDEISDEVETAILKLRYLFSDDPLLNGDIDDKSGKFCTYYSVEKQYDTILKMAHDIVHTATAEEEAPTHEATAKELLPARQPDRGEPLTPRMLGRVENTLQRADISNLVRRQYVCGLVGDAAPQPLFSELYISIRDLCETLMPGINIVANPWLFHHLTETLDRRMLAMLSKSNDNSITGEISINLNVSTLLSPEFMQFDDSVIASMRGSFVVELQKVDIFSDINAFLFARAFAKERGYRICIDGLTYETLPFINRERLEADMIKVIWQPDVIKEAGPQKFAERIKAAGGSKTILCRCTDKAAIEFGHATDVKMFQGRYIEDLIADDIRRRDMQAARRRHNFQDAFN